MGLQGRWVWSLGAAVGLLLGGVGGCGGTVGAEPPAQSVAIGERATIEHHVNQPDLVSGQISFDEMFHLGEQLFLAKFNALDGQGRPGATGNGVPTHRAIGSAPPFVRTSGNDSNSCAGCHNDPRAGGGGDFVANVFVLAQLRDPVTFDVRDADERNTLGMMGSGAIELLGREMTADLQAIRDRALQEARTTGQSVQASLDTKGVNFGSLTAHADGTVDTAAIEGVDADLVIKPFHQKGVVRSLREFTVNAMNQHHGMEAVERFGRGQRDSAGNVITTDDFDGDGVPDELTVGDITAVTMWQAMQNIPAQVFPGEPERMRAALVGEQRFAQIGCTSCHRPALVLNSPTFCEPYALNTPGTLSDQSQRVCADLTRDGPGPRLVRAADGTVTVQAFTDLKRHVICDDQVTEFGNEQLVQAGVPTTQFITRKLWDVGNSAPYGHRGDLSTITEAILAHGGEGRASRDSFAALPHDQQSEIVEFLKTLQVVPEGTAGLVADTLGHAVDKAALGARFGVPQE
jgi:cytochrome c peroxidase